MILYVKGRFNVSGSAYHEIAQLCKDMARHYKLKQRITELNTRWNTRPTPEGTCGVQQPLEERLHICLQHLVCVCVCVTPYLQISKSPPDALFLKKKKVRVKPPARCQLRVHLTGTAGNHCLAIFKEPEEYDSLLAALQDIKSDVESLSTITVDGIEFAIEYYLGGDWKFLALATGIDSAASTYACIWCKCPSAECHISTVKWSMLDPKHGACSIKERTWNLLAHATWSTMSPAF